MAQSPYRSNGTSERSDDTSDRLYTPEELASYAAREAEPYRADPLTDPLPLDCG